ncbi:unnamed protein product [Camellia sinensis]
MHHTHLCSSRVGQKHTTHDNDQLAAQYQPVLGATFEDSFNTCQHLPSGPAEEFTRPTNSNDFGLEDQDDHLFTGRPNQQLPLSGRRSLRLTYFTLCGLLYSHSFPLASIYTQQNGDGEAGLAYGQLSCVLASHGQLTFVGFALLQHMEDDHPSHGELSWFPEKYLAELNLPFVTEGPAVQTSQLPYSGFILVFEGYISKPESPNPQLPTSSAEFYCENNTMVAQGLSCPGGNVDYLWNRNKPFPSEKEHLVESPEKLTWIGDFGFVAQEPWPGNIFVELELPPVHEDPGLPNLQLPGSVEALNSYQVMGKSTEQNTLSIAELHDFLKTFCQSVGTFLVLVRTFISKTIPRLLKACVPQVDSHLCQVVGDHCNQTVPPHLVETSYASLNPPLINNGNSNGADLGLPLQCKRAKLCSKGKDQRRPYNKFRLDETDELTEGVQKYAGMYCCWIKIKDEYFKNDPHRTPDNLKQKWKHMMERDPSLKKLYKRALIANKNAKFKSPKCKQGRILKNI